MIKLGVELNFSFVWKSAAGYMKASVMGQRSDEPYPHKVLYILTSHSSEAGTAAAATTTTAVAVVVVVVWARNFSFLRQTVGSTHPQVEWVTVADHWRAAPSECELTTHSFISDVWNNLNFTSLSL